MSKKNAHLGSIFTPDYISEKMAEWAIQNKQDKILDLGIGEGAWNGVIQVEFGITTG